MEPDVVCADALTANSSRTTTSIGLKYLIPSPFLAVCVWASNFCGPKLTDQGEGVSRKFGELDR